MLDEPTSNLDISAIRELREIVAQWKTSGKTVLIAEHRLWLLRDIAVIGVAALLSVLALSQGLGMGLLVVTVLYAFLTIQVEGSSILDFLRRAANFLFLSQQYYEWRLDP